MGDKPSTSQSSSEDVADPPLTFWRRTSRRLLPVEVVARDHLLRRPLRDAEGEPPTGADPDGPSPPKRECRQPDQSQREKEEKEKKKQQQQQEKDKEKEEEEEEEKEEKEDPYECPLCLESVRQRNPVSTKCGHVFCQECLEDALRKVRKCPMCNARIKQHPYIRIYL